MQRGEEGQLRVVSYLSKALTDAQKAYGVHERELFALLYCLDAELASNVWSSTEIRNRAITQVQSQLFLGNLRLANTELSKSFRALASTSRPLAGSRHQTSPSCLSLLRPQNELLVTEDAEGHLTTSPEHSPKAQGHTAIAAHHP